MSSSMIADRPNVAPQIKISGSTP